jgi:Sigma-70, region 4
MNLPDYLPPVAREIAEVIGLDGLMRLVKHYGGIVIRVPGRGDLKQILTPEQYKEFTHTFRNEKLAIPKLQAQLVQMAIAETKRLDEEGLTRAEIARQLGITERAVYNRLAVSQDDDRQAKLF